MGDTALGFTLITLAGIALIYGVYLWGKRKTGIFWEYLEYARIAVDRVIK